MRTFELGQPPGMVVHSVSEIEKAAAWVLGMAVAVAVFFQVHVSFSDGPLNVNLADPFAVLALAGVSLQIVFARQLPVWRIPQFNLAVGLMSVLLLLGFMHGWMEIGITQWALGGRLFGWVVLLGYISAGYLIVTNFGGHGLRRLAETLMATMAIVVMLQVLLRLLALWGAHVCLHCPANFEGYAGNRNAFALQVLVGMVLLVSYSGTYSRHGRGRQELARSWIFSFLLGVFMAGLVWSGSRMGMLVGLIILLIGYLVRPVDRRMLGVGVIFAVLLWLGVFLAAGKVSIFLGAGNGNTSLTDSFSTFGNLSQESSNLERWDTLIHGMELWRQSPLLGAGLGVFHENSPVWLGHRQVIHSTPLWILAEFGLLGGAVFGWVLYLLVTSTIRSRGTKPARHILFLLLVVFSLSSLVHEILYQRIFWLVLGAVLAMPRGFSRPAVQQSQTCNSSSAGTVTAPSI